MACTEFGTNMKFISDNQNVFSLNGLEIDLDELEEFEKRVKAKRELEKANNDDIVVSQNAEVDELDEYLKSLKLKEEQTALDKSATTETDTVNTFSSNTRTTANFALLLYWFFAILNLASATFNNRKHCPKR